MNHDASPLSGPLHIDIIRLAPAGVIGLTHCPGRSAIDGRGRAWGGTSSVMWKRFVKQACARW
ncbi:MAG: hypothetical protein IPI73_04010 [Betaproteobacteria bacterium]|nr:hypothetical protein [Betaproteobacteria bacterium]